MGYQVFSAREEWSSISAGIGRVFFNRISNEFSPLNDSEVPRTFDRQLPELKRYQVAMRLKRIKKPRSKIRGDIFPSLVTEFSDILAEPLTDIYNQISTTLQWPAVWKIELVTVIPKCPDPKEFDSLRNISCTLLVSKVYESFLLLWACLLYTSPSPRD